MKKTITIQNLITLFTQSWWAKIFLCVPFVALLFFSCEDPESLLGFKDETARFKVRYIDIPLESSQLLMDSVLTQGTAQNDHRLLVGQYSDPLLGTIRSIGIAQYAPPVLSVTVPFNATLDSAFFTLKTDFYEYGLSGNTTEEFELHEVTDELTDESKIYSGNTITNYDPAVIGVASLSVDKETYDKEFNDTDTDPVYVLKFALNPAFADRLLHSINAGDNNFTDFAQFRKNFKGLAIVPKSNSKITGFTLNVGETAVTLYYHNGENKLSYSFLLSSHVNYSMISTDRSGTDLSSIPGKYQPFLPGGNNRFIQSGAGLITKLDFKNFYNFADTAVNPLFNSAQLIIENISPISNYTPPSLVFRTMRSDNRYFNVRTFYQVPLKDAQFNQQDLEYYQNFAGNIVNLIFPGYYAGDDDPGSLNAAVLQYDATTNSYKGFCTIFFQKVLQLRKAGLNYNDFALFPHTPSFTKSVNRMSFKADQVKLRIYYTSPTKTQ